MRPKTRALLLLGLFAAAAGCQTFDDSRVLQALNQRGFGRKYVGDSNEVLTVGIGDELNISDPGNEEIEASAVVRMDGVIHLPLIQEVFVAGFSTEEIAQAVNQRYAEFYKEVDVEVQVSSISSKKYFLQGEIDSTGARSFEGNTTVWDAIMDGGIPATADLEDIYVIRADPRHPLIIPINLEKMLDYGDSSDNILIREDDIVVVNPNFAGMVKNAVELILEPIQPVVLLATSVRNIKTIYDSFVDDESFFVGSTGSGFGGSGFNTFGGGGGTTTFSKSGSAPQSPPPDQGAGRPRQRP